MTSAQTVMSLEDADKLMEMVRASASRACDWLSSQTCDPIDMLRRIKFERSGFHPIEDRPLNFIEQINQTWTFAVAIAATRQLLQLHPDVGGFHLAPGAHASLDLDIMSVEPGAVGAETFAAVTPRNNGKLAADIEKLKARSERYRYVFFMSPLFPRSARQSQFETAGIEVWSIEI